MSETLKVGQIVFKLVNQQKFLITDYQFIVKLSAQGLEYDLLYHDDYTKTIVLQTQNSNDFQVQLFLCLDTLDQKQFAVLNYFLYMYQLKMLNSIPIIINKIYFHQSKRIAFCTGELFLYTQIDLYCARLGLDFITLEQSLDQFLKNPQILSQKIICIIQQPVIKFKIYNQQYIVSSDQDSVLDQLLKTFTKIVLIQQNYFLSDDKQQTKQNIAFIFALSAYMLNQIEIIRNVEYFSKLQDFYNNTITLTSFQYLQRHNNFQLPLHFYSNFLYENDEPEQLLLMFQQLCHVSFAFKAEQFAIQGQLAKYHNGILSPNLQSDQNTAILTLYYYLKIVNIQNNQYEIPILLNSQNICFQDQKICKDFIESIPTTNLDQNVSFLAKSGHKLYCNYILYQNTIINYIKAVAQMNKDEGIQTKLFQQLSSLINIKESTIDIYGSFFSADWIPTFDDKQLSLTQNFEIQNNIYLLMDDSLFNAEDDYIEYFNRITQFSQQLYLNILHRGNWQSDNLNQEVTQYQAFIIGINSFQQEKKLAVNKQEQIDMSISTSSQFKLQTSFISGLESSNIFQECSSVLLDHQSFGQSFYEHDILDQVFFASPLYYNQNTNKEIRQIFFDLFKINDDDKYQLDNQNILFNFCHNLYNPKFMRHYVFNNVQNQLFDKALVLPTLDKYIKDFFLTEQQKSSTDKFKCYSLFIGNNQTLINNIRFGQIICKKMLQKNNIVFQHLGYVQYFPSQFNRLYFSENLESISVLLNNFKEEIINIDISQLLLFFNTIQPELAYNFQLLRCFVNPTILFKSYKKINYHNSSIQRQLSFNIFINQTNFQNLMNVLCPQDLIDDGLQLIIEEQNLKFSCQQQQLNTNDFMITTNASHLNQSLIQSANVLSLELFEKQIQLLTIDTIQQHQTQIQKWFSTQFLCETIWLFKFVYHLIGKPSSFNEKFNNLFGYYLPAGYQVFIDNCKFKKFKEQALNAELLINQVSFFKAIMEVNSNVHYFSSSKVSTNINQKLSLKLTPNQFTSKFNKLMSHSNDETKLQIQKQNSIFQFRQSLFQDTHTKNQTIFKLSNKQKLLIVSLFDIKSFNNLMQRQDSIPDFMLTLFEINQEPLILFVDSGSHTRQKMIDKSYQNYPIVQLKWAKVIISKTKNSTDIFDFKYLNDDIATLKLFKNKFQVISSKYNTTFQYSQPQDIFCITIQFDTINLFVKFPQQYEDDKNLVLMSD